MTATNHALSGATIGLLITQPVLALPLALASHFVLDAMPHFGLEFYKSENKRKLFHKYLIVDAILLSLIIGFLLYSSVSWLVLTCLFLAGCPDFVQAYQYLTNPNFRKNPKEKSHWFTRFHKNIQWSESVKGLVVEIPFAILLSASIINLV
jgi:hypothetical protein